MGDFHVLYRVIFCALILENLDTWILVLVCCGFYTKIQSKHQVEFLKAFICSHIPQEQSEEEFLHPFPGESIKQKQNSCWFYLNLLQSVW